MQVSWPSLLLLLGLVAAAGLLGGRRLYRAAEHAFWSLNSIAVQPGYALWRELIRHLVERVAGPDMDADRRARLSAISAAAAGLIVALFAVAAALLAWPYTRWIGSIATLAAPQQLILPALANAVVILSAYLGVASLIWGTADATMSQPRDLAKFDLPADGNPTWRVAHLSDCHVVGERYGFRIESGRAGPCGNDRLDLVLDSLEAAHAAEPVDLVLITGDMTDAGRSTEWAEFLAALARHPSLMERALILPGNHDISIVDRANPARLDLPTSPRKRLRELRALSAMMAVQGDKVSVTEPDSGKIGITLAALLAPHAETIAAFADAGSFRLSNRLMQLWSDAFPMVLPPTTPSGLGVILLNSVADTHFSFTNALGLVSTGQTRRLLSVARQFPDAKWLIALHHHLVEYPRPVKQFSERVGTALINGSWFVRQIGALGHRAVLLHGHRHIDWIGACGDVRIISAPSPIMNAEKGQSTHFYIHRFAAANGRLALIEPTRVDIPPEAIPAA
jgi:hypothetical protein